MEHYRNCTNSPEPNLLTGNLDQAPAPSAPPYIPPAPAWVPKEPLQPDLIVEGHEVITYGGRRESAPNPIAAAINGAYHGLGVKDRPINIGIKGKANGHLHLGTGDDATWDSAHPKVDDLQVNIFGLDGVADIGYLRLGDHLRFVKQAYFLDVNIEAYPSNFALWNEGPVGNLGFDNVSITPAMRDGQIHRNESLVHLGEGWRNLFVRDFRRGERNGVKILPQQHVFYPKGGGDAWFMGCDLGGGNRTGINWRPHPRTNRYAASPRFSGTLLIDGCYAEGFGWDHPHDAAHHAGGSIVTLWSTPDAPAVVRDCRFTDARYGCFAAVAQPDSETNGNYRTPWGHTHLDLHLEHNYFENRRGDRYTAEISCTKRATLWPENVFEGRGLSFGSKAVNEKWGNEGNDEIVFPVRVEDDVADLAGTTIHQWVGPGDVYEDFDWKGRLERV